MGTTTEAAGRIAKPYGARTDVKKRMTLLKSRRRRLHEGVL